MNFQEFCAASATKDFARVVYVEIKESTRSQCSDLLKALGHVPLAIRTGPTADTSIFIFKSRRSRDTLSLRFSRQGFVKSGYALNGFWARFKRHADTHSVDDLLYDG